MSPQGTPYRDLPVLTCSIGQLAKRGLRVQRTCRIPGCEARWGAQPGSGVIPPGGSGETRVSSVRCPHRSRRRSLPDLPAPAAAAPETAPRSAPPTPAPGSAW